MVHELPLLDECRDIFTKEYLEIMMKTCELDICEASSPDVLRDIVAQLVAQCRAVKPSFEVCDWEEIVLGRVPECGPHQVYKGQGCKYDKYLVNSIPVFLVLFRLFQIIQD